MVREKVWLEVAWAIRRVIDRVWGGSEYRNSYGGLTTHMEATGGYVKEEWGKGW